MQRNKELEKRAREAERTVLEREKLISELRLRMPATADRDEMILRATTKVSEEMSKQVLNKDYESEQALKIAQSTMASLKVRNPSCHVLQCVIFLHRINCSFSVSLL